MLFLTCSWKFLRYGKLEQLEFKLEKKIEIYMQEHTGKVRKCNFFSYGIKGLEIIGGK